MILSFKRGLGHIRKGHFAGFTLIELLVVIAIIGILSAVVLASLTTARTKGADAAIQSDLDSIRTEAEVYYNTTGNNSYTSGASCAAGMFSADTTIVNALTGANNNSGGTAVCASNGTAYAVGSALKTSGKFWCVDSTGQSKAETVALPSATYVCQ
jgi:prepilin-type N-terminal cleavage/methylation domain-containing protein